MPDISQFLDDNKGRVDRDPDGLAYDDLRHYAYEGDGNSMGSLSSLASGKLLKMFIPLEGIHLIKCYLLKVPMTAIWTLSVCPTLARDLRSWPTCTVIILAKVKMAKTDNKAANRAASLGAEITL